MITRDTFIRAVIAATDDDLPRLIFSDWLDEHGDPLGEFIRVQCRLAELEPRAGLEPDPECDNLRCRAMRRAWELGKQLDPLICGSCWPAFDTLRRRERELLKAHGYEWMWDAIPRDGFACGIPDLDESFVPRRNVTFRRGFVEEIACPWEDWCRHADAIRAATPLRKVRLTTLPFPREFNTDSIPATLARMYPGVEFELPPVSRWANYASEYTSTTRDPELERRWRDAVMSTPLQPPDPTARR